MVALASGLTSKAGKLARRGFSRSLTRKTHGVALFPSLILSSANSFPVKLHNQYLEVVPLCDRFSNPAAICAIQPQKFLMAGLSRAKTSFVTDIAKLFADADIAMGQRGGWTKQPSGALSTRRDNF
jgi:hypothetical protein